MKSFIKQIGFFIIMFLFAGFTACGGGGSSSAPVAIVSGDQISFDAALNTSDYSITKSKASGTGLKIVAIPIMGYMSCITFGMNDFMIEAPVNADGSFKLNLNKKIKLTEGTFPDESTEWDTDYVLLVVDSSGQVISFISMADFGSAGAIGGSQTVVKLPISTASSAINLGTLTKDDANKEAKSNSSSGGNFSLNINQLRQIAQGDDIAKSVKNEYLNQDLETKVFYNWTDTTITTDFNTLTTAYSNPDNIRFKGCNIGFWEMEGVTGKLGTFDNIRNKITTIALYPPSTVISSNTTTPKTYDEFSPISNDGAMIQQGTQQRYNDNDFTVLIDDSRLGCVFGGNQNNLLALPSGEWKIKKDGTQIGSFDFAVGNPFVTNSNPITSKLKTYVPTIQIIVDGSNIITGLKIKYYLYDGTNYQEVTDSTILRRDRYYLGLGIDIGASSWIFLDDLPGDTTSFSSADLGIAGTNISALKAINVSLNVGPFSYGYSWRKI